MVISFGLVPVLLNWIHNCKHYNTHTRMQASFFFFSSSSFFLHTPAETSAKTHTWISFLFKGRRGGVTHKESISECCSFLFCCYLQLLLKLIGVWIYTDRQTGLWEREQEPSGWRTLLLQGAKRQSCGNQKFRCKLTCGPPSVEIVVVRLYTYTLSCGF